MVQASDGVILLHGIGRSSRSMATLERACRRAGYDTLAIDYPGRRLDIAALAGFADEKTARWIAAHPGQVHFVTHSMGGLVARALIARRRPARLGRIVMLGPPNQGSEIADLLASRAAYRSFFGPAGLDLTTMRAARIDGLSGAVDYPLGIIAGRRALDPLSWLFLPKPNDGKVTVARTRLVGMTDHLILPVTHTLMMHSPAVVDATLAFLRDGRFRRGGHDERAGVS